MPRKIGPDDRIVVGGKSATVAQYLERKGGDRQQALRGLLGVINSGKARVEWDESEHPRDHDGKFTFKPDEAKPSGGGENKPQADADNPGTEAAVRDAVLRVAALEGIDPANIEFTRDEYEFKLNGQDYKAAGSYHPDSGKIRIYLNQVGTSASFAEGLTFHEIQHHKWKTVLDAYEIEKKAIIAEANAAEDAEPRGWRKVMSISDDTPTPEYAKKYPVFAAMNPHMSSGFLKILEEGATRGGGTDYSDAYWKQWVARGKYTSDAMTAINETLAEMAATQRDQGRAVWKDIDARLIKKRYRNSPMLKLFHAVTESYKKLRKKPR
jgi:hypothetical protein